MKKLLPFFLFLFFSPFLFSQVAINNNGSTADASAMLDVSSTTNGVLIPRMTALERKAITSPAEGLLVYETDTERFWYYSIGAGDWLVITQGDGSEISDEDGDTKVQVEQSNDEDIIRFDLAGTEHFTMTGARLNVLNSGYSVFMGENAGANDDGSNNGVAFVGYQAGMANTSGAYNTAIGYQSLLSNTTGSYNTAIGRLSLNSNITNSYNTAIGNQSLQNNNGGSYNSAIGSSALADNTTGSFNVAIGSLCLSNNTSDANTAFGSSSLMNNTSSGISAFGANSLKSNTTGTENSAFGYNALMNNTTGDENTAFGYEALATASSTQSNTAFGYNALNASTGS